MMDQSDDCDWTITNVQLESENWERWDLDSQSDEDYVRCSAAHMPVKTDATQRQKGQTTYAPAHQSGREPHRCKPS